MDIEIRKVANGYIVVPIRNYRDPGTMVRQDQTYAFQTYQAMSDKLQEILESADEK